ncbi:taste receptor type 2 member 40-like [Rana temporaria]|uniref:taste receptor type 2 member 40-like n=1 Tax=Rana temporaria TaxID=8407 RepID=UPI001AADEC27|nr:taste receptor type 2 member 40-like [Rana temporaria]
MRRISEGFSIIPTLILSFCLLSLDVSRHLCPEITPNLSMMSPDSISFLVSSVLGLVLAIPSNTCIVMGNLDIIRKKGKLSPSDVIFLGKGIVNILLQCVLSVQGMLYVLCPEILYIRQVYGFVNTSVFFLTCYNFWLIFWLSAHYCTSITNLSYGFFIWIKRIVSNFLSHLLFLTALGVFIVSVPAFWTVNAESPLQFFENSTEASVSRLRSISSYFVPVTFLGCILPFCLSLLCLVLTSSFLLRHVWRVKNNDSGSTRPNLQAHVTALRTIFFLLLMFKLFCIIRIFMLFRDSPKLIPIVNWNLRLLSQSVEAAIIFQASKKLRRIILRKFWTRSRRNTET